MQREQRGEKLDGSELRSWRQRAKRLRGEGGVEVECVFLEHRQIVIGGCFAPFESEFGGPRRRLRGAQNVGKGVREATLQKGGKGESTKGRGIVGRGTWPWDLPCVGMASA